MAEAESTGGSADSFPSDELECKICYNPFDLQLHRPKLLDCSHSFCSECLDALHSREGRGWRLGCPLCRHRTPLQDYQVHKLPDNTALTAVLPLGTPTQVEAPAAAAPAGGGGGRGGGGGGGGGENPPDGSGQGCKQVAFATGCVCATFSFLCMVVLLFLGLIFVHNLKDASPPPGPLCLSVAGVLALLSLILTWCALKYRLESEASSGSSLTYI